jgi:hypothetical protein
MNIPPPPPPRIVASSYGPVKYYLKHLYSRVLSDIKRSAQNGLKSDYKRILISDEPLYNHTN